MIWFTDAHCTLLHHHIAPSPMSDMIICCFYGTHSAWHTKPGSQSLRNKKKIEPHTSIVHCIPIGSRNFFISRSSHRGPFLLKATSAGEINDEPATLGNGHVASWQQLASLSMTLPGSSMPSPFSPAFYPSFLPFVFHAAFLLLPYEATRS